MATNSERAATELPGKSAWGGDVRDPLVRHWVLRILHGLGAVAYLDNPRVRYMRHELAEWLDLPDLARNSAAQGMNPEPAVDPKSVDRGVTRMVQAQHEAPPWPQPYRDNLDHLAGLMGLTEAQRQVLGFIALSGSHPRLMAAIDLLPEQMDMPIFRRILAGLLDLDASTSRSILGHQCALLETGLVHRAPTEALPRGLRVLPELVDALAEQWDKASELLGQLIPKAPAAALGPDDFDHLYKHTSLLEAHLRRARAEGLRGVNVLVYGPPGTGKTEFVRMLAAHLGGLLFEVPGEVDGLSLKADERLLRCRLAQRLLRSTPGALLLFDEVEDALAGQRGSHYESPVSKHRVNQLLETNPAPTFWVCNDHTLVEPWQLRRFDYVMSVPLPPRSVRRRIARVALGETGISEEALERIIDERDLSPAVLTGAARLARGWQSDVEPVDATLSRCLAQYLEAAGASHGLGPRRGPELPAQLELYNADRDLEAIVSCLDQTGTGRLCLHGPPGTGKTTFARLLATRLDRDLITCRPANLLSPYCGETERAIRRMFDEAERAEAVLLVEDIDTFLGGHECGTQVWEQTRTSEMLCRLEAFQGILVATTSQYELLDRGARRNFDFRVGLDSLRQGQLGMLLDRLSREADLLVSKDPLSLPTLDLEVTTGDVSSALRRLAATAQQITRRTILAELQEGQRLQLGQSARIGFTACVPAKSLGG